MQIKQHPSAKAEFLNSFRRYHAESVQAAEGFLEQYESALNAILKSPEGHTLTSKGRRWRLLQNYPYKVIYEFIGNTIWVVAVAHVKRRPNYWAGRKWPK